MVGAMSKRKCYLLYIVPSDECGQEDPEGERVWGEATTCPLLDSTCEQKKRVLDMSQECEDGFCGLWALQAVYTCPRGIFILPRTDLVSPMLNTTLDFTLLIGYISHYMIKGEASASWGPLPPQWLAMRSEGIPHSPPALTASAQLCPNPLPARPLPPSHSPHSGLKETGHSVMTPFPPLYTLP